MCWLFLMTPQCATTGNFEFFPNQKDMEGERQLIHQGSLREMQDGLHQQWFLHCVGLEVGFDIFYLIYLKTRKYSMHYDTTTYLYRISIAARWENSASMKTWSLIFGGPHFLFITLNRSSPNPRCWLYLSPVRGIGLLPDTEKWVWYIIIFYERTIFNSFDCCKLPL